MTREECREVLLEDLKEAGLLLSIEPIVHEVGHSERTGVMVEPMIKKQWFVKMDKLAETVLNIQNNKDEKINFVPDKFEKTLTHWMEDCHDWCISRQLWWGHRIPAWYKDDEVVVTEDDLSSKGYTQDEDVLDTWFSSALWTFATMGWPESNEFYERYHNTDCLVTGYDIIFFWVARMAFQTEHLTGTRPFKDCVIHGLIRDKEGRKMSKSLGNGVDPFDMKSKYGVDALRYYLCTDCAMGTDLRFDETKMSSNWNFINKIWNASRFVLMNIEDLKEIDLSNLSITDKWILTKYQNIVKSTNNHMDNYDFNLVGMELFSFIYDDFCSNYIEYSKFSSDSIGTKSTLCLVLTGILKMLHPFMPFVTEEIYQKLPIKDSESIMISNYPEYDKTLVFNNDHNKFEEIVDFVKIFRNIKQENNIPKDAKVIINNNENYDLIIKMLKLSDNIINEPLNITKFNVSNNTFNMDIFYEKVLTEEDKLALEKQIETLRSNISRREKLLSNHGYVSKAPANLVEQERQKLAEEKELLDKLTK